MDRTAQCCVGLCKGSCGKGNHIFIDLYIANNNQGQGYFLAPSVYKMLNKMVYLYEIFKTVQYPFPIKIKKGNEHYGFHIENNKS